MLLSVLLRSLAKLLVTSTIGFRPILSYTGYVFFLLSDTSTTNAPVGIVLTFGPSASD